MHYRRTRKFLEGVVLVQGESSQFHLKLETTQQYQTLSD